MLYDKIFQHIVNSATCAASLTAMNMVDKINYIERENMLLMAAIYQIFKSVPYIAATSEYMWYAVSHGMFYILYVLLK